jgi:Na+-driven multidrug efflux pump
MGVTGAAIATLSAEVISATCFITLLLRRKLIRWSKIFRLPSWEKLQPLLKGGAALQLRNVALNLTFLGVTRVTQSLDDTGVAAAAHALAIQTFNVGGIVLLALSVVAQTVVPNELIEKVDAKTGKRHGGKEDAKAVVNRLMSYGFIFGGLLGGLQLLLLPLLQKSSPLLEVRQAAVMPSILASVYQLMNGLVFIGEGVMIGCGNFMQLSLSTAVATVGSLISLYTLPNMFGLTGVWMSFGVFNTLRFAGVWLHQTRFGPLANANMNKAMK